jgi:hypothetical protein
MRCYELCKLRRRGHVLNGQVGRAFEWFLESPIAVVLGVLWVVGAVLEGTGMLVLYLGGLLLVRTLVGA